MEESKNKLIESFLTRGVENIIPDRKQLDELLRSEKKLNVYLGIDPTATRIHLGHAFPLRKLQILSDLGHQVTFLIGDFTAKIGDTSDKEGERPILTDEQIRENFETYKRQAEKFLDFSKVELHYNSEWLSKLDFSQILELTGYFSLNDFISRELIRKRLDGGKRVSLPETLYPIMQGYDSYHLDTDIQLGGTDQTFNMQAGRTLNKQMRNKESYIVANAFLPGTDGRKMSKTWGNAIWVEDPAGEIFGKVMSLSDDVILTYYEMGTNADQSVIDEAKAKLDKGENPMKVKRELAKLIVSELCGGDAVEAAETSFQKGVVDKTAPEETKSYSVDSREIGVVQDLNGKPGLANILVESGLAGSRSEVKRLLDEGALYVDDKRITKEQEKLELHDGENLVRVGKRKYLKLTL